MADLLEHFVGQKGRERCCPFGPAARAESPLLAARRHQELISAPRTPDTGKARLVQPAVEVGVHDAVDEAPPETVSPFEALFPHALDRVVECLNQTIQRGLPGPARPVESDGSTSCDQGIPLPCRSVVGSTKHDSTRADGQDGSTIRSWQKTQDRLVGDRGQSLSLMMRFGSSRWVRVKGESPRDTQGMKIDRFRAAARTAQETLPKFSWMYQKIIQISSTNIMTICPLRILIWK